MGESTIGSGFVTGFGSATLQFAFERFANLGSVVWRELGLVYGADEEYQKLLRVFHKIQDLVDHMESNTLRFSGRKAWQIWFEKLRKLAYDAEALLDHVSLKLYAHARNSSKTHAEKQVFSLVLSSLSELKLPHSLNEMQAKLEELAKEMEGLNMIEKLKQDSCKFASMRSIELSNFNLWPIHVDGESIVGRAQDKEKIINLLSQSESNQFSVISLVGMAGVGKTTVARLVYDDVDIIHFEKRIWVSVPMEFDLVNITKSIIESATLSPCNLTDLNSLQLKLQRILSGKKFLLVIDGYWNERHDDWNVLSSPFRYGSRGSKVIVTTRSMIISSIISSSQAYKLDILSDDDCWELINKRICRELSSGLELIGKEIANRCKGLPLAAVSMARVLRCKTTEDEWRSISKSEMWDVSENIFPSLMLSYIHLPSHLKRCISYCSIFPKDHEFEVKELVLLWMAEGFIQPVGARKLEDLGNDYFNALHLRCFFKQGHNSSTFKMHGLIHDMTRLVANDICFHVKYSMTDCYPLFANTCHLSLLHDSTGPIELKDPIPNERLRTFLVMSNQRTSGPCIGELDSKLFLKLQFLRVLGLSGVGLNELPDSIDHLTYIRYLNLSRNPIFCLPDAMCNLVALQTLKLIDCSNLQELPEDMSSLTNLRHLELDVKGRFQSMPSQFGRLTNLQTLSVYVVSRSRRSGISELKNFDDLRGSLCIRNMEHISKASDAREARLDRKKGLDKLELQWKELNATNAIDRMKKEQFEVLKKLVPHTNLKELVMQNYCGITCPEWLGENTRQLTSINLQGLKYCDKLPALGSLPLLKSFTVSDMPCLKQIDDDFYGICHAEEFPSLVEFELCDLPKLRDWTNARANAMQQVITFTISRCPDLRSLPQNLQNLLHSANISGCQMLVP